ncbi:MAG: carbohydrate kinase family protein [Candidatus Verstraetearchaeota archaeon]|nr:carbohydrate kinase family protein [Candidatus Verstraetearchaeota archaeon]
MDEEVMEFGKIIDKIIDKRDKFNVVALHDYFIDHFIYVETDINNLIGEIVETATRGGGNIFKNVQSIMRGGCAANFSAAIAKLGGKVKLITCANNVGLEILKRDAMGVDLSHVKIVEDQAITAIIESRYVGRQVNIMISYPGILSKFNPKMLNEKDWEAILNSNFTCMFTWNVNKYGNELIESVARKVKENGRGKVYIDLGDPRHRIEDLRELMGRIISGDLIDAISLNENELNVIGKIILNDEKYHESPEKFISEISRKVNFRLDVHTPEYSATSKNGETIIAPCFKVNVKRTTGAGDAWNAGNIMGWGAELEDYERLIIANAVAAIYISKERPEHPNIHELKEFIEKAKIQ